MRRRSASHLRLSRRGKRLLTGPANKEAATPANKKTFFIKEPQAGQQRGRPPGSPLPYAKRRHQPDMVGATLVADRGWLEAILRSIQGLSEPHAIARAVLGVLAPGFHAPLLALYQTRPASHNLNLLATQRHRDFPRYVLAPPDSVAYGSDGELIEAMQQHAPLIKRVVKQGKSRLPANGKEADESWWQPPVPGSIIYLPLWAQQCEGILLVALPGVNAVEERDIQALSSCAPLLAEVLTRVRLQAELTEERQRERLLLDQLPEGIVIVEARSSTVSYANPVAADLLGCELTHLIGTPLNRLAALTSSNGLRAGKLSAATRWNFALIDALWGKTVTNQQMSLVRADGSERTVLCSAAPFRASSGLITEAVMVLQDMTTFKQLERQKNEFFAVASHELRTPLTAILGWVELLAMTTQATAEGKQQQALTHIVEEGEHLRRLIQDLLDVSRLEEGHLPVNRRPQELLTPLRELVNKQAHSTSIHHIHFTVDGLDPTAHLVGDVDLLRLEQIVTNLLSNAIKYSPGGGDIEVGVCPRRGARGGWEEVLLWVKDHGIGISARDSASIFERFYRADSFERSSISGFGIGLYLTRKLVNAHGGRIWVESQVGEGSTFFVVLPLGTIITG